MDVNDLMIGDLVQVNGEVFKVISISYFDIGISDSKEDFYHEHIDNIEPIPLTQKILEKNGFVKQDYDGWLISENNGRRLIEYRTDYFGGLLIINYVEEPYSKISIKLKYVHELQHALKLCRFDKDIDI